MNAKQLESTQSLTKKLDHLVGGLEFNAEELSGNIMVTASNTTNMGYGDHVFVLAMVGKNGGVTIREGSSFIRKMVRW